MKKIIQKIAGLALGLSLAMGVGVALASHKASEAKAADAWTQITALSGISDGDEILIANAGYYLPAAHFTGGGSGGTAFDIEDSTLSNPVWKVGVSGSNYTFSVVDGSTTYYLYVTNNNNGVSTINSSKNWSIAKHSTDNTFMLTSSDGSNTRYLTYASGNFRCYKTSGSTGDKYCSLYKRASTPVPVENHTITYDANGGTGTMEDTVAAKPTVAACTFEAPAGKVFDRWNTQANGNGTDYTVGQQVTSDVDLFAIWKDQPSCVTLDKIGTNAVTAYSSSISTIDITDGSNTYTLNYVNGKKQNDAMIMQKSSGAFISNKTVMPGNISSIELFINSGASGSATYDVAFSATEITTATAGIGAVNITGGNSHEYANSSVSGAKYFCITLGAAYNGQVLKIVINYESVDPSLKTMVIKESGTAAEGGSYAYKASGTYTFEAYEESTKVTGVTWSVSDSEVATINASSGALTTVKPGSVVVTAKAEGYNDATASIEITKGTVSSVSVTGNMTKTAYFVGESWSSAGLTATAYYSTGWYEDVSSSATWTFNPASPVLTVESVTATATFGGQSGSSSVQSVSVSKVNPIQALYSLADQSTVTDIYGYFVGKIDNSNIVIMDGAWGIDLYSKDAYSSISYVENETILKVSGTISIYNGFYEILPTSVTVATSSEVETPIVYTAQGGETSNYCSRVTSVSGIPTVTSGDITKDCGAKDLTMSFDLGGGKSIPVFYHRNSQVAADYAKIQDAVNNNKSITVKGFTSWYQNAIQVKMNGIIDEVAGYTAEDFAQDLLDQTDAVCTGYKDGDNNHDAIEAIWSNLASNDKYPSLPSDQKTILAEAERNEKGTVVEQAMARYDYLTGRYNLSNFINGRTPITTSGASHYFPTADSNSSTIIIVVVALTSITSIGVLLVIKRRRALVK